MECAVCTEFGRPFCTLIKEFRHGPPSLQQSLGHVLGVLDYNAHPHILPEAVDYLLGGTSLEVGCWIPSTVSACYPHLTGDYSLQPE